MGLLIKGSFGWRGGKVEGQKMVGGWKSGKIEKILISLIFVCLGVEKWRDKKVSLYKFTHKKLLKKLCKIKTKK